MAERNSLVGKVAEKGKKIGKGLGLTKGSAPSAGGAFPLLKIALPSSLSPKCGESVYGIVSDKLKTQQVRLLLDASEIRRVDQEGLRWLYEISALMKGKKLPKVILRKPNRILRDAMILANVMRYFEVIEDVDEKNV
jgi:ABC-type transporter Mla MlaB component